MVLVAEIQEDDHVWVMFFYSESALNDYLEINSDFKVIRQAWIPETELQLQ